MDITMELSEILLYLELLKKHKKKPNLTELNILLYFIEDYQQVKAFINQIEELNFKPPGNFYFGSLIHFIEDYEDCITFRNKLVKRAQKEGSLYIQQILLSKSKQQATEIMNEARKYDVNLNETWADRFDSMWEIKRDQEEWRKNIKSYHLNFLPEAYQQFQKMKSNHFESISLNELKQSLSNKQPNKNTRKVFQTVTYDRSIYVKEFARRVAKGICQLCENEAPFRDKQGNPFLEIHHIHYLSRGGTDTIDNVVALCPNCHSRIHNLELQEDYIKIKNKALENINI